MGLKEIRQEGIFEDCEAVFARFVEHEEIIAAIAADGIKPDLKVLLRRAIIISFALGYAMRHVTNVDMMVRQIENNTNAEINRDFILRFVDLLKKFQRVGILPPFPQ